MDNSEVARVFYEIADYLELQGVAFKPQAYRRGAANIEQLEGDISEYHRSGRLGEIPGIGEAIAEKIGELVTTGKLGYLEKLRSEIPKGILDMLEIPDIGPKKAMMLFKELDVKSVDELKAAIFDHRLQALKGFGAKTEEKILQGIRVVESRAGRSLLGDAHEAASRIITVLRREHPGARMSIAGSLRRMKETVGDIDILAGSTEPTLIMETFTKLGEVEGVIAKGDTKSSIRLKSGIQVDLRVVPTDSYGAALQYFTGSKEHNVELRKLAISKDMKISEYGLFERDTEKVIASKEEEDIYEKLGLQFIPPELREGRGEISIAAKYSLPTVVEYGELKGDLHCHTEWSDASGSIEAMWRSAFELGYEYLAITDHSQSLKIASGLTEDRLLEQISEIRKFNEKHGKPFLFAGSEVDVLADGKLDYPKRILDELDFAVMSVHSRFKMEPDEMTRRITTGMSNDKVRIFGHPTGRIIGQRIPYSFDFEKIIDVAKSSGIALEINSYPERLDLNDVNVKHAIELGGKISIDSDAHGPEQLALTTYGVATARRGWAKRSDIINTLSLNDLKRMWGL